MEAVRCTRCGETRWSLFSSSQEMALERPCEVCGGPTVAERRHPGTAGRLSVERRSARFGTARRPRATRSVVH
jgi:hypothetical protein